MEVPIRAALAFICMGVGIGAVLKYVIDLFRMRNCDRFDNFDEAHVAFLRENPGGTMYELDDWLFKRVFGGRKNKEAK